MSIFEDSGGCLETNKFYWFRHNIELIWRVGYVGIDSDKKQWLWIVGITDAWEIAKIDLGEFEWIVLEPPNKALHRTKTE